MIVQWKCCEKKHTHGHARKHPRTPTHTHSRCAARWSENDLILSRRNRGRGAFAACCVAPCGIDSSSCKKMHDVKTCLLRYRLAGNDSYLPPPIRLKRHKPRRPPGFGRADKPQRKHISLHNLFSIKVCDFQTSFFRAISSGETEPRGLSLAVNFITLSVVNSSI